MKRTSIKKSNQSEAGTWEFWRGDMKLPVMYCPNCGEANLGNSTHTIEANGNVNASIVCANDKCDFHEFVKLEDWDGFEKRFVKISIEDSSYVIDTIENLPNYFIDSDEGIKHSVEVVFMTENTFKSLPEFKGF